MHATAAEVHGGQKKLEAALVKLGDTGVGKYLDETGYHNGRLVFFEAWAPASDFYTHVAKRLLSNSNSN